jgi:hypothetical protein
MGISLRHIKDICLTAGHKSSKEQVPEQVEDHGQNGQAAAAGHEFGDMYKAHASDAINESSLT